MCMDGENGCILEMDSNRDILGWTFELDLRKVIKNFIFSVSN